MSEIDARGLHYMEDDLAETWVEDWAGEGVAEIEVLLAKHLAFLAFLETQDKVEQSSQDISYPEAA
jgi:hypothetical protein